MTKNNQKVAILLIISTIALVIIARIFPHIPNFAPITALSIFAGYIFQSRIKAMMLILFSVLMSDVAIQFFTTDSGFYPSQPFVYLSYGLIILLSSLLTKKITAPATSILSSIIFFAITNFGVWVMENFYPHSLTGLVSCYTFAIRFFGYSLLSDVVFTVIIFGLFSIITQKKLSLQFIK